MGRPDRVTFQEETMYLVEREFGAEVLRIAQINAFMPETAWVGLSIKGI